MLTSNSTPQEIQNASQQILDMIALKDEYIKTLEEKCIITDKLLKVKDQVISNRDMYINELKLKLDEVMELAKRAVEVAERNVI